MLNAECILALKLILLFNNGSLDFLHSSLLASNLEFKLFFFKRLWSVHQAIDHSTLAASVVANTQNQV